MNSQRQHAFTAIELIIVISVIMVLAAMIVPATMRVMQKTTVNRAAEALIRVHREARQLAMVGHPVAGSAVHVGVALVAPADGSPSYAVLLLGTDLTTELMADDDSDGLPDTGASARPRLRLNLPPSIEVLVRHGSNPAAPLSGRLGWFYAWRTGEPLATTASSTPISIGTPGRPVAQPTQTYTSPHAASDILSLAMPAIPPSPVCSSLSFGHRGGRYQTSVSIYAVGIAHRTDG